MSDQGERGPTGDHGQHGDTGETGATGQTGARGVQGIQGEPGKPGIRGRALTWMQALAMFALILVIGLVMAFTVERQQARLERNQAAIQTNQTAIAENARLLAEQRYQGCIGGVRILETFNTKVRKLAAIERRNTKDPLAKERVKAYEDSIVILPATPCRR